MFTNKRYKMNWNDFQSYKTISDFLKSEAEENDFVRVKNIGRTHEKRPLNMIAIEKAGDGKPNIFVEGGIDPLGQPKVTAGRDHCFRTCFPSVRPSPLFKSRKKINFKRKQCLLLA